MKKISEIMRKWVVVGVFSMLMFLSNDVLAATVSDSGFDNTTDTANAINIGDTISGSITQTDDLDYYKFQLPSAGCLTLNMTSYMQYYCIKIFDADGEEIWYTDYNEWTESVGYRRDEYRLYLEKGNYYMQVNGYRYGTEYKSTGRYGCETSFQSSSVNNVESDNSFSSAGSILLGNKIIGQISENDDFDSFKFSLSSEGCVTLNMTSYMQYYCIKIFDADGEEIWYTDYNEWTESVGYRRDEYKLFLEKGNYYMQVNGYRYGTEYKSTGRYVIDTKFLTSGVSFTGNNNSFATSDAIEWNVKYTGQISINDDYDTYKFRVPANNTFVINMMSYMQYYCIKIFDTNGEEIWYTDYNEWNSTVGYRKDSNNVTLSAGTYYMQINGYRYGGNDKSTGKYIFSVEKLNQSNCSHDYVTSYVDATYLAKGYTLHKCKKCGKSYKDNYIGKKTLGKGYIWNFGGMTAGKRKFTVSYQSISDVSGYQIRYSTNKQFKKSVKIVKAGKNTTTKTIKKLKKRKRYYVQVRGYKKVRGKIVYGKWSGKRSVKTK